MVCTVCILKRIWFSEPTYRANVLCYRCSHSKRMAPAWQKLAAEWADTNNQATLVAEVDCTKSRPLCKTYGVTEFPSLVYGDPSSGELEEYTGGRSYEDLARFAKENLKPPCSASNTEMCDEDMRKTIEDLMAKDTSALLDLIDEEEENLAGKEEEYGQEVEKLTETYNRLEKEKNEAIGQIGLKLLKSVTAYKKKMAAEKSRRDEL